MRATDLLRLWGDCARGTAVALGRSPWTLVWPMALLGVYVPAVLLAAPLGFLGGLLIALVYTALLASFLYVVSDLVHGSPVRFREMRQSVRPFFWPIMNVLFVLWIARFFLGPLLGTRPNGAAILLALQAVLFILLNAVPEVIYQRGTSGGLASMSESVSFLQRYWVEWLPPNLAFAAALYFGLPALGALPLGPLWIGLAGGAFVHAAMVFRGLLFRGIDGTSARQRELRARLGR